MKRAPSVRAFSLVEVALALGIIAFSVVGIIGLLATAINSGKASTDDTLVADMAAQIINDLRHQYFVDRNQGRVAGNYGVVTATNDVTAGAAPASVTSFIYFDVSGTRLQSGTPPIDMNQAAALAAGAIYQCKMTSLADAATLSATGTDSTPSSPDPSLQATNLLQVTMVFTWPVNAANSTNTKTLYATVARY